MLLSGCLSTADPGFGDGDGGDGGGDGDGTGDVDDLSIDGRLHNEGDTTHTFSVTIRNDADEEIASDEWDVAAGDTLAVPGFGRPGELRAFEVTVDGISATEIFEFDVESTPGKKDGYVDITYTADGEVEIAFTPAEDPGELPARIDEPPYEITEPECDDNGERDPLWLCANMSAEPSLSFDQVETSSSVLADEGLSFDDAEEADHQFYAALLTAEDDLDRVSEDARGEAMELIEGTDFDDEAVLVVQTGWGSGSVTPHLKRIEATEDGIHAFGCYRSPCLGTTDVTVRTAVARFERPDVLADAFVSLTMDPDHRVHFEVGEGVVSVDGL